MYRTSTSSEPRKSIRVAEKQWKMTKEWQEKVGKEDTLFKDKLLEKKKKLFLLSSGKADGIHWHRHSNLCLDTTVSKHLTLERRARQ